jgi:hypothetical protein
VTVEVEAEVEAEVEVEVEVEVEMKIGMGIEMGMGWRLSSRGWASETEAWQRWSSVGRNGRWRMVDGGKLQMCSRWKGTDQAGRYSGQVFLGVEED